MPRKDAADPVLIPAIPPERGLFCNRTLNLRSIKAVGYDMDYTLVHYRPDAWERKAFEHLHQKLLARGWPLGDLTFDARAVMRGLVYDIELGNVVKANRFGYVKQAQHGSQPMSYDEQRAVYSRTIIDLADPRFVFANTLFSLCKGATYAQLVDRLDAGKLPEVVGYRELFHIVRRSLDEAHMEGELKADVLADPERYVELDAETPLALLDQRQAGKKLLLITNSEWSYTRRLMAYAFDRFLPRGMSWRDLFEVVIVAARKPDFFSGHSPVFEIVDEEQGLLRPAVRGLGRGVFFGGNAAMVEQKLGLAGDQILYIGDHIYSDVSVSKQLLRWRTGIVVRELEDEVRGFAAAAAQQRELGELMEHKEQLERALCRVRLLALRRAGGYHAADRAPSAARGEQQRERLKRELLELDQRIAPLARASSTVSNAHWGPLMRAGNDKSQIARMIEQHADVYTSRVSNFSFRCPDAYLRGPRGSLPHDAAVIARSAPSGRRTR